MAAFDLERDALSDRKSWFFFDDEHGTTCATDCPAVTTLNQCRLAGEVLVAKDKRVRKLESKNHSLDAPNWLRYDRVGYVLLGPGAVRLHNGPQQGSWPVR